MATLPDATALPDPSIGGSGRPIATYDTTGYARGAAAIAQGVSDIGKGLTSAGRDVAAVARKQAEDDEKLEVARAKSEFLTRKVELDATLADDTDHATLPQRYGTQIDDIRNNSAKLISNPRTRELFTLSTADDVARGNALADRTAKKLWSDATLADTTTRLEEIRQSALKSTDPEERKRLIETGNDLIQSLADKGIYTKEGAAKTRQEWTTKYAAGAISMLPPEDRIKVLGGFEGRLARSESSGNPALVNQFGYVGLYQFGAPRLAALGLYKPGDNEDIKGWSKSGRNADGKWSGTFAIPGHPDVRTVQDFLRSPEAQRAAFNAHSARMDQEIQANGLEKYIGQSVQGVTITREGLHAMMHLGGVGGAKNALEGKGNATDANGTSVLDYAKLGNQSDLTRVASLLPEDTRVRMRNEAQNEWDRTTAKAAAAQSETWERQIIDAGVGVGTLPNRKDIEQDPSLDEPRRNALLRQYDSAAADVVKLQNFMAKFKDPNAGAFNPYDADERKFADKAFTALGADGAALQAVVARTGMMPKSAAAQMRGSLVSNDPKRVADALTLSANLINANPNIFVGVDGKSDFENNAVAFRHYVDTLGMTADDAAKRIIRDQSPEYQAGVKARLKTEDIDGKIKKELSVNDLAGQFDQVPWIPFTDPKVGFDPRTRLEMFGQYAEQVKDRYLETGDWGLAKKQAADQLKKTWGVSKVNGSQTVMQYPPERAPIYAGIENASEAIAKQAVEAVRSEIAGAPPKASGLIEAGNIDLNTRPVVKTPDGKIATVRSMSVNIDGQEVLIPTVGDDGKLLSPQEAEALYLKTGKHLGKFDTPDNATAYGKVLSEHQGKLYGTDIDRKSIRLSPIPGVTAQAYKTGQPVPYMLSWADKNGVLQMLNPGRAFVADPAAMRSAQSEARRTGLEKGQAEVEPLLDMRAALKANRERLRKEAQDRIRSDVPTDLPDIVNADR